MIDPRHLTHLLAIEEHGSFSRAAEALGVSQPALSNSIALLERRLGTPVLNRSGRGASVNEVGHLLVRRARELRSLLGGASEEVRLKKLGLAGPLNIGATPGMGERLMPELLARLRAEGLSGAVRVMEGRDDRLIPALLEGEIDFALGEVAQSQPFKEVEEEILLEDPFYLGVGPAHPLAGTATVNLAQITGYTWVMALPGGSAYSHAQSVFRAAGVPWPEDVVATNSIDLTKRLIADSQAIGMVTGLLLACWDVPIHRVRVIEATARKVGIKRRPGSEASDLALRAMALLRDITSEWRDNGFVAAPQG